MTITVMVVDDQAMVRAGLRMLLSGVPDLEVVAEAANGLEAVARAARFRPQVTLMDIRMPELDGLEATRRILAADPHARVLVLTTFGLDEYVYEALHAGASGFVLKDDPPEQVIAAVRTIAAGDALLSPSITQRVIAQFARQRRRHPPAAISELTSRSWTSTDSSRRACRMPRSAGSCSSATQPSRPTSREFCTSSTSGTALRPLFSLTSAGSSSPTCVSRAAPSVAERSGGSPRSERQSP